MLEEVQTEISSCWTVRSLSNFLFLNYFSHDDDHVSLEYFEDNYEYHDRCILQNTFEHADAEVSRWHCRFEFGKKGICRVVDLQSANGTNLNEKSVVSEEGAVVSNSDVIYVRIFQSAFILTFLQ